METIKLTTKAVYGEQKDDELVLMFPIQKADYWKAKRLLEHLQDALLRDTIPPCWCHGSKWYNIETGEYFDPPLPPVYVRINGRKRQAKRWLWLWRVVARVQG